jgi:hypothetical protein
MTRYEPYGGAGKLPVDCCDFSVVDNTTGQEICRCWDLEKAQHISFVMENATSTKEPCNWPESGPCACYMATANKPDPHGRVWMHCEQGLSLSKASMSRFVMFCLLNDIEIGSIYPFNYHYRNSQVSASVLMKPEQFEAFEAETHGKLRKPPRIVLNTIESKEPK